MRFTLLVFIASLFGLVGQLMAAGSASTSKEKPVERVWDKRWTTQFDPQFRKHSKHYFGPAFDWRWFKSQAIAESTLRADARSKTGAVGLMQIQPATFAEIKKKNPHFKDIATPRWNIAAGIYYDRQLYKRWQSKGISPPHRLDFSLGAYNAGFVGILRAIKKSPEQKKREALVKVSWPSVERFVPTETKAYVSKINRLMGQPIAQNSNTTKERG